MIFIMYDYKPYNNTRTFNEQERLKQMYHAVEGEDKKILERVLRKYKAYIETINEYRTRTNALGSGAWQGGDAVRTAEGSTIRPYFKVTPEEMELIEKKMEQAGIKNKCDY